MNAPEKQSIGESDDGDFQAFSDVYQSSASPLKSASTSPVIVIGAPRSGTNLIRDLLATMPGMVTWPCDEINAVWTYSNTQYGHDALPVEAASGQVRMYIQNRFNKVLRRFQGNTVVEKTCANSLRVNFVNEIFPDARFIFIHRNGLDAATSASLRWHAPIDFRYTLAKVREVPLREFPRLACRFAVNRLPQLSGKKNPVKVWGPDYGELGEDAKKMSTIEVCAKQWGKCVEASVRGLSDIPKNRVLSLSYETFVTEPDLVLKQLSEFLEVIPGNESKEFLKLINSQSIGNSATQLSVDQLRDARRFIDPANAKLEKFIEIQKID